MESQNLKEIDFEYAQTSHDKHNQPNWYNDYLIAERNEKIRYTFQTMLIRYASNLFILSAFVLLFIQISEENERFHINSVILFILYILPLIIEFALRFINLLMSQNQFVQSVFDNTNIEYQRLKTFQKKDLFQLDPQYKIYQQAKSYSLRSIGLDQSQSFHNPQQANDIVLTNNIEKVKYRELQSGDFILLQRNQQCPGDMVILDMSDKFGFFYSKKFDSYSVLEKKESTKTTKVECNAPNKGDLNYIRKIYKGKLVYDGNYTGDTFEGHIKLFKDPKGESVTEQNILYFGQVVQYNEWVLGLLINAGYHSYYHKELKKVPQKKFKKIQYQILYLLQIILYIALPFLLSVIIFYGYNQQNQEFRELLLIFYEQFLVINPGYLNLILYIIEIVPFFKEASLPKKSASDEFIPVAQSKKKQSINYGKLINIMDTSHAFLNISIIQEPKVEALCISDSIYLLEQNQMQVSLNQFQLKTHQFYLNHIKEDNIAHDQLFTDKTSPIKTFVAPEKLSIASHIENQKLKRVQLSPNRSSKQIEGSRSTQIKVFNSVDGGTLSINPQNPINLISQVSQDPDEDVLTKQLQISKESQLVDFGQANPFQYFELFTAISLCHLSRSELIVDKGESVRSNKIIFSERTKRKNKFKIHSFFLGEDEALLKLSKRFRFGYRTYGYNKQEQLCYILKLNDIEVSYIIKYRLYHQGFSDYDDTKQMRSQFIKIPSRFIAMIIKDENFILQPTTKLVLLCRFCIVNVFDIPGHEKFDLLRKAQIQKQLQFLSNKGNQIICYVKLEIDEGVLQLENELIINNYDKTAAIIELLYDREYEIIGLFGISLPEYDDFLKDSFLNTRTRIIIQSDKPHELVHPYCMKNYLVHPDSNTFNFSSPIREDILYQFRQFISQLCQDEGKKSSTIIKRSQTTLQYDKIKLSNNSLIIDGKVFEIIMNDKYLANHLGFIIHFNKNIIFYNMNPKLKVDILEFFKQYDQEYVASICVNNLLHSSYGQVRQSDFTFSKLNESSVSVFGYINQYDIIEEDQDLFDNLIIKQCFQLFQIKDAIIRSVYSTHLSLAILTFLVYIHKDADLNLLSESNLLFFQILSPLISTFLIVRTIFGEQEFIRIKLCSFRAKALKLKNFSSTSIILEGLFDSILILMMYYISEQSLFQIKQETQIVLFTAILLVSALKQVYVAIRLYQMLFSLLIIALMLLLYLLIQMINVDYQIIQLIFSDTSCIMTLIWIILVKFILNMLCELNIFQFKHFLEKNFVDLEFHLILEQLSKLTIPAKTVQYLIKKVFKDQEMDLAVKAILNMGDKNQLQIQLSSYSLDFQQANYYQEFWRIYLSKWKIMGIGTNLTYFLGLDIFLVVHYSIHLDFSQTTSYTIFILMLISTFIQALLINQSILPKYRKLQIYFGLIQTCCRLFTISAAYGLLENYSAFFFYFLLILSLNQQVSHKFTIIIIQQIITFSLATIMLYIHLNQLIDKSLIVILLVVSTIISIYCRYQDDMTQRDDFICSKELENERSKYQQVMSLLLPHFVLARLTQGNVNFSENQGQVGILFVDFCQFDLIVSEEKQNIVQLIDNIYRNFDQLCSSTNCQKIETVGKTYMACAGLQCVEKFQGKSQMKNPIERLIELAFGIVSETLNHKWGNNNKFNLKIGIHYGRVLMGVIGSIKPQFSLIGDTVNTASRMCALSPEGGIQISQQAHDQVKNVKNIKFVHRQVEAKGKGLLDAYLVEKRRNFDSSFSLRKPKQTVGKIDQKLKFVLHNQNSFHNKDKPQQQRQITMRNITGGSKLVTKPQQQQQQSQQQQDDNNLLSQMISQPQTSQVNTPKLMKGGQQNSFHKSQMQLLRKQTKRNVFQQIPTQQQVNPNLAQLSPQMNFNTSLKQIPQKSIFSQLQPEQQAQLKEQQQLNHQGSFPLKSEACSPNQRPHKLSIGDMTAQLVEQSIILQESQRIGDGTPLTSALRENQNDKKFTETNIRIIKFGDVELSIKVKSHLSNENIPLFKIQEFFMEKKPTINQEYNQLVISFDSFKESMRRNEKLQEYYNLQLEQGKGTLIISYILLLFINIFFILISQTDNLILSQTLIRSLAGICILFELYLLKNQFFEWTRLRLVIILVCQQVISIITLGVYYSVDNELQYLLAIEIVTTSSLLFTHKWLYFQEKIFISAFMFITWLIIGSSIYQISGWEVCFILISQLFLLERELLTFLTNFNTMQHSLQIQEKQEEKINLLSCLLPVHVLTKFLDDSNQQQSFSDVYNDCTILFADIAGFTKYSSSVQPEEVVSMLRNLFNEFDNLTQIHNVFKLYTIGDCYVVIGVTDNLKRDPVTEAFNVVEMSLNMLEAINLVRNQINYHDLHMRIGIHTGNVIGGIIGTDIIRYDVYGKDILIANKMESSSEEDRVLVSESTKKILEDHYPNLYTFTGRKLIPIQSINTIVTGYFLNIDS